MPKLLRALTGALFAALPLLALCQERPDCRDAADAQVPVPEAVLAAMRDARDHGFLWRIRKDAHTSYLYGTMHVGRLEWMFPGPRVMRALQDSQTLALELDPLDPQIQAQLAAAIAAMPHRPIPAALQVRLRRAAESLCVPYDSIAPFAPEFQVVTLGVMAGRASRLDAQYGTDIGLATAARGAGMEIVSLETPQSQLSTLTMRDAAETVDMVRDGLEELEPGRSANVLVRMSRAWADSDYDGIAHYPDWCQCLETEIARTLMKRLLDGRNPELADGIDRLHAAGKRVFAATGSLHLFGPTGLPALLERRGYEVERIELAAP